MFDNIFARICRWHHISSVIALCTILILLGIHNNAFCEPVPFEKAKDIAANWMIIQSADSKTVIDDQNRRSADVTSSNNAAPKIHVVNFNPSGYVLLSSDTVAKPIIAYSTSDSFSWETLPPAFLSLLQSASAEIEAAIATRQNQTETHDKEWEDLADLSSLSKTRSGATIGPLLKTKWGQGKYYNASCPKNEEVYGGFGSGYDGHTMVGCVAVAMGQIMKFHKSPERGYYSHSYIHPTYGKLEANFAETTYLWDEMPNSLGLLSGHNKNLADFLFHVGVAVDMNYGDEWEEKGETRRREGSGAWIHDACHALKVYFGYEISNIVSREKFDDSTQWLNLMKTQLDNRWPIYYQGCREIISDTGEVSYESAHAFVIDGYKDDNYFHVNWGWDGTYQGTYYLLDDLTPGNSCFNSLQSAIINIMPACLVHDVYEPNNSIDSAFILGELSNEKIIRNLNIHAIEDNDWFCFSTVQTGEGNHYVGIDFEHINGNLDIELYRRDNSGAISYVASSKSGWRDQEYISLDNLPSGTYYIRIYGLSINSSYDLTINPPTYQVLMTGMTVFPPSGSEQVTFTYQVNYYDPSGMFPQEAKVYINGTAYDMTLENGTYANGTYKYSTRLPDGNHNYLFKFKSGNGRIIESELFSGPVVGESIPHNDLVITRPSTNPYYTSRTRFRVEALPPDGTTRVECYRNDDSYGELSKNNEGLWDCNVTLKKGENHITLKAYNDGNTLLDEASINIIRQGNIQTVTLRKGDYVWGGAEEVNPKKHYGNYGNVWYVGHDGDGWNEFFLRFNDISDKLVGAETQPGNDTPITSAELMLTVLEPHSIGTGTYNVIAAAISSDWQLDVEYVRWNNRPESTYFYGNTKKIVPSYVNINKNEHPTLRIDATTAVSGWVKGDRPNKGFWLWGDNSPYGFLRGLNTDDCLLAISYTHETTPPDIIINTPPANERQVPNATTSISVSGTASDNTSVSNVTWKNENKGTSGNCNGTTDWNCSVDLIVGENRIIITATDAVGNNDSSTIFVYRSEPETLPTPYALPHSGSYLSPLVVTVICPESGTTIRYTKDGTDPTEDSEIWSDRTVDLPANLKFKAFKPNWLPSATFTAAYSRCYNATVNSGSGTGTYKENHIFPIAADPIPFGYESFEAWTVEPEQYAEKIADVRSANTTFTMPAADVILTATYKPRTYTVIFKPGDIGQRVGGGELIQQIAYGEAAIAPEIATENGLDLIGWNVDFSQITRPLTVRAVYAHRYNLNAGWNLISNNLILNDQSQLFLRSKRAMTLSPAGDAYVFSDHLTPPQACWIYCQSAETFTLTGTSTENFDFAANLKPGWNFVGPITDSLLKGNSTIAWGWDGQHLYPTENIFSSSGYYLYWPEQYGEVAPLNVEYLVIDLSAGSEADSYPISYRPTEPAGGWPDEYKTTKLVLRKIPAGTFMMGSPADEDWRGANETLHQVTLTQNFYVGVFEVTQKQWERVMGTWPSYFKNSDYRDSRPVDYLYFKDIRGSTAGSGWPANNAVDADSFLGRLRSKTSLAFDLPTEAQWEYACRAGTETALNSGKNLTANQTCPNMNEVGRYTSNGGLYNPADGDTTKGSAKVGSYLPNQWGLYDMHGNVFEYCLDWWDGSDYPAEAVTDPKGLASGSGRVIRGGYYRADAEVNCSARRNKTPPNIKSNGMGFRLAWPIP